MENNSAGAARELGLLGSQERAEERPSSRASSECDLSLSSSMQDMLRQTRNGGTAAHSQGSPPGSPDSNPQGVVATNSQRKELDKIE